MFFLFGVKGGLLFLITKKEKSPLKTSLFFEQQKRFREGLPAEPIKTKMVLKSFEPKTIFECRLVRQNVTRITSTSSVTVWDI